MNYWWTSDYHFSHFNIIRYCKRPFETAEEMNETIIKKHNERVKPDDTVFFLGDFIFKGAQQICYSVTEWIKKFTRSPFLGKVVAVEGTLKKWGFVINMDLEAYIKSNYVDACKIQRNITKDEKMKSMLQKGDEDTHLVMSWMRDYGLFQGISKQEREKISMKFLSFAKSIGARVDITHKDTLRNIYSELFKSLFDEVNRSWMSATSKLLWCVYPDDVVIYDSFVERALVVMQCLDKGLSKFPRIGVAPKITSESDIASATSHYMNYQGMVRYIYEHNIEILNELRNKHKETYPHDIRIVDKLLWMIGNPKYKVLIAEY